MAQKILIVGGVAGGATAAARLRRLDETAEIILLEKGDGISFANCGLPYYIGDVITDKGQLTLQTPQSFYQRFRVEVRTGHRVTAVKPLDKILRIQKLATGESYEESYDTLVLATGTVPVQSPFPGADLPHVFTLKNITDMERIKDYMKKQCPKTALIIGAGAIGIEMAENLHAAKLDVTILEKAGHILPAMDHEMTCEIKNHIQEKGVTVLTNAEVRSIDEATVNLQGGEILPADLVILCLGVRPDTDFLAGSHIRCNARGAIQVSQKMRTNMPDVYAVGDAVAVEHFILAQECYIPLADPANKEGRIAANNIFGLTSRYKGTQGTSIVKCFDMLAATTGITEETAKAMNMKYEKIYTLSPSHTRYYPGATSLTIKLIYDTVFGRILGAQVVGYEGIDKCCGVLATAIRAGLTVYDLAELELCYTPPYSSAKDPVNMAGYVASNVAQGLLKIFHLSDLSVIDFNRDLLLDVRTEEEFQQGAIPGAVNIPLDSLRDSLDRLPKEKPIYLYCQIGLEGYIAARILTANGYAVKNLSGGYRLYSMVQKAEEKV